MLRYLSSNHGVHAIVSHVPCRPCINCRFASAARLEAADASEIHSPVSRQNIYPVESWHSHPSGPKLAREFLQLYRKSQATGHVEIAQKQALSLVNHSQVSSGLIWLCALKGLLRTRNYEGFKVCFKKMLSSQHALDLSNAQILRIWGTALRIFRADALFLHQLFHLIEHMPVQEGQKKCMVYGAFIEGFLDQHEPLPKAAIVPYWNRRMLEAGFRPNRQQMYQLAKLLTASADFRALYRPLNRQMRRHKLPTFQRAVISVLCRSRRFEDAQWVATRAISKGQTLEVTNTIEDLLTHAVKYFDRAEISALAAVLDQSSESLTLQLQTQLAYFHGKYLELELVRRRCAHTADLTDLEEDAIWAQVMRGATHSGHGVPQVLGMLAKMNARIGEYTLQACVEVAPNIDQCESIIRELLMRDVQISPRGFAVFIRHCTKSGLVSRADRVLSHVLTLEGALKLSPEEVVYVRRCYLLGLIERQDYRLVEEVHSRWCASSMDSADTWNLLVRSRISSNRVQEALKGLEEMKMYGIDVENATAEEFVTGILRHRKPGHAPDVMLPNDRRAYLADIKEAIAVVLSCIKLGNRVQPETWREIFKRLGWYGEFDSLILLTNRLIPHYQAFSRFGRAKDNIALLKRLIPDSEMAALVSRGSRAHNMAGALRVLIRWQSQGVIIPLNLVNERIRAGLRYIAGDTPASLKKMHDMQNSLYPLVNELYRLENATKLQTPVNDNLSLESITPKGAPDSARP